jgi:hypothetical protein
MFTLLYYGWYSNHAGWMRRQEFARKRQESQHASGNVRMHQETSGNVNLCLRNITRPLTRQEMSGSVKKCQDNSGNVRIGRYVGKYPDASGYVRKSRDASGNFGSVRKRHSVGNPTGMVTA